MWILAIIGIVIFFVIVLSLARSEGENSEEKEDVVSKGNTVNKKDDVLTKVAKKVVTPTGMDIITTYLVGKGIVDNLNESEKRQKEQWDKEFSNPGFTALGGEDRKKG